MTETTERPIAEPGITVRGHSGMTMPERRVGGRWLAATAASAGLALLVLVMVIKGVDYFPIDVQITRAVQTLSPVAALPLEGLSVIGFPPVVLITYAMVVLLVFLIGFRLEAVVAGLATLGAAGLTELVKHAVQRPRPSPDLVHVAHHIDNSSFPAGHVLNITAFVGFLCYIVWARMVPSWRRTALLVLLPCMIILMGPARIYAGEHWASDVLGGYLVAISWLAAVIALYQWWRGRTSAGRPAHIGS